MLPVLYLKGLKPVILIGLWASSIGALDPMDILNGKAKEKDNFIFTFISYFYSLDGPNNIIFT
jgi:hypothetical protein